MGRNLRATNRVACLQRPSSTCFAVFIFLFKDILPYASHWEAYGPCGSPSKTVPILLAIRGQRLALESPETCMGLATHRLAEDLGIISTLVCLRQCGLNKVTWPNWFKLPKQTLIQDSSTINWVSLFQGKINISSNIYIPLNVLWIILYILSFPFIIIVTLVSRELLHQSSAREPTPFWLMLAKACKHHHSPLTDDNTEA